MSMPKLGRVLVVGLALLLLTDAYVLLVTAVQVLALPRFEIPFADGGMCGFGSRDPYWWATLALLAPGLSFAPLRWAGTGARRKLASKATGGLALLLSAVALSWLAIIGQQVAALASAMGAWRIDASGLTHPGFAYPNIKLLLEGSQLGLGSLALALALLLLALRLGRVFGCQRETLTALRAGLLLLLGAMLTVREAWENESGCFPLWPAFTLHPPSSWYGLWTTSVGFYGGCLWLVCAAWRKSQRFVAVLVPSALAMIYCWNHGSWGSGCACQAIDVPEQAASAAMLGSEPATAEPPHAPLVSEVLGSPHPPANMVLRLADDAPLDQVRSVVEGARAAGFHGITFEFALPTSWTVGWWLDLPGASLTRVPLPFADGCECELDLSQGNSVRHWLRGPGTRLLTHECCLNRRVDAPL